MPRFMVSGSRAWLFAGENTMKTQNDVVRQADFTASRAAARADRAMRFVLCMTLLASAVSTGVGAEPNARTPAQFWANNGCFYTLTGRGYVTELCRRPVAPHTFDYWNPVRREWLLRIEDNPANLFLDVTLLQGPMRGWTARLGAARPGQNAVRAGIWSIRNPQGVWTNVPVPGADTPAGAAARSTANAINDYFNGRGAAIVLGGIPIIR
jgi:hypothetical protein